MRVKTDFKGWQSDIDYEANEAERVKRVERAIYEYKKMNERIKKSNELRPITKKMGLEIIISIFLLGIGFVMAIVYFVLQKVGKP